jgi:hypothetical protein
MSAQGTERGIFDSSFVIRRQRQFNKAEEVFEDLGVFLYTSLPVLVNASLESPLCLRNLIWVWGGIPMVERLGGNLVQLCRVIIFPSLGEQSEVFQNIVLSVTTDPRSGCRNVSEEL